MKGVPMESYRPSVVNWNYPTKIFKADVLFGTPGRHCKGVGICRVGYRGTFTIETNSCQAAAVEISYTNDKRLQFKFKKNDLCQRIQKVHFRHDVFRIAEDFWIPDFVTKALWLKTRYKVKRGRYNVEVDTLHFIVKF